jgi:hypothetical protein
MVYLLFGDEGRINHLDVAFLTCVAKMREGEIILNSKFGYFDGSDTG